MHWYISVAPHMHAVARAGLCVAAYVVCQRTGTHHAKICTHAEASLRMQVHLTSSLHACMKCGVPAYALGL